MGFHPSTCHPSRKIKAKGLCSLCYESRRRQAKKHKSLPKLCSACHKVEVPLGPSRYCSRCKISKLRPKKHCAVCREPLPIHASKYCGPACSKEAHSRKRRQMYLLKSNPKRRIHHRRPTGPNVMIDREKFRPALERMLKRGGRTGDIAKLLGCPFGSAAYHVRQMYGMPLKKIRQRLQQEDKPVTIEEDWEQRLRDESLGMDRGKSNHLTYGHQFDYEGALGERAKQRSGQT